MTIFWRLLFAHLLADFTFQTDFIARWKQKSAWGMLAHCGFHLFFSLLFCMSFLGEVWIDTPAGALKGWVCILLLFALHFIEDEWRVFMIGSRRLKDGTGFFIFDQAVHLLCIAAVVPEGAFRADVLIPELWAVFGCLAVSAAHGTTVILYYLEKDMFGNPFPEFSEKYYAITERLFLSGTFLLPGKWGYAVPVFCALAAYQIRSRFLAEHSWFGLYVGGALAFLLGVLARGLI